MVHRDEGVAARDHDELLFADKADRQNISEGNRVALYDFTFLEVNVAECKLGFRLYYKGDLASVI